MCNAAVCGWLQPAAPDVSSFAKYDGGIGLLAYLIGEALPPVHNSQAYSAESCVASWWGLRPPCKSKNTAGATSRGIGLVEQDEGRPGWCCCSMHQVQDDLAVANQQVLLQQPCVSVLLPAPAQPAGALVP